MNDWRTAEAATPVYDVSERGCSLCVGLVGAPFEVAPGVRACEGGLQLLEGLEVELRVRDDVGGWAR